MSTEIPRAGAWRGQPARNLSLPEVHGSIEGLRKEADEARRTQAAQGVISPGDLSAEARVLLSRAPLGERAEKTD